MSVTQVARRHVSGTTGITLISDILFESTSFLALRAAAAGRRGHIYKLEPRGGFLVTSENCSNTVLSAEESCTIDVVFTPIRPGHVHSNIYINNDYDPVLSITLFGDGT